MLLLALLLNPIAAVAGEGGISFVDIASVPSSGLDYERTESASTGIAESLYEAPFLTPFDLPDFPVKWRGAPGVALLDFDGDGDTDIYVTNGPGSDNSLFSNQQVEGETSEAIDVAVAAGVAARDQDSSGVCFGDTDNDGDPDLLVLSNFGSNRFFENQGDGTFQDLSATNGLGADVKSSVSCSFGDMDGDGLLDVVIANTWDDMSNGFALGVDPFAFNQHNQLFRNVGGNHFVDVSASSGILDLRGFPPASRVRRR